MHLSSNSVGVAGLFVTVVVRKWVTTFFHVICRLVPSCGHAIQALGPVQGIANYGCQACYATSSFRVHHTPRLVGGTFYDGQFRTLSVCCNESNMPSIRTGRCQSLYSFVQRIGHLQFFYWHWFVRIRTVEAVVDVYLL